MTAKSTEAITGLGRGGREHLAGAADAARRGQPGGGPAERGRRRARSEFAASLSRSASSRPRAARRSCSHSFPPRPTTMRSRASRKALIAFGTSAENIFDLRREELRQIAVAQASLQANNSLVLHLGKEVAELVLTAQNNSDAAALRTAQAIRNGQLLLLAHHCSERRGRDRDRAAICGAPSRETDREHYRGDERPRRGRHVDRRAGSRPQATRSAEWPRRLAFSATRLSRCRDRT